jgi:hypothetical protein
MPTRTGDASAYHWKKLRASQLAEIVVSAVSRSTATTTMRESTPESCRTVFPSFAIGPRRRIVDSNAVLVEFN